MRLNKRFWFGALAIVLVGTLAFTASVAYAADILRVFDKVALGNTRSATARLNFAPATTSTGGVNFGDDVALFRSAANKLQLSDSFDLNLAASSATAVTYPLILTNTKNASSMTGTGLGIQWNQYYYDATTPAIADAGYIGFATAGNWTSTGSTQDSLLTVQSVVDGSAVEVLKTTSAGVLEADGNVVFGNAATDTVTVTGDLTVSDSTALNGAATALGDASTDVVTCTGRLVIRNVTDAGPMTATAGTKCELVYNTSNDKVYVCTVAGSPATWAALN